MAEYDEVMRILMQNANKQFVQRVIAPQYYPQMDAGDGNVMTHKMEYSQIDTPDGAKYIVYPRIVYNGQQLVDLGDSAYDAALHSGEYIQFDNEGKAKWFSRRYKAAWEKK